MQQSVTFKNIDGKITILAQENLSFESFIKALKNRLDRLYIKDDLLKSNVVLNIKNISLDSKKILSIFDVFAEHESIYLNKIIYNEDRAKNIVLHEGNIRAGEIKLFTTNTLLIGNINKDAKVIINGKVYDGSVATKLKNLLLLLYHQLISHQFQLHNLLLLPFQLF